MKVRYWLAAAALVATAQTAAMAQGPTAPAAPRTSSAAAVADGKIAVVNSSVFTERILELRTKIEVVNKKYEARFKELETMRTQIETLGADINKQRGVATAEKLQQMSDQLNQMQTTFKRRGEDLQAEYNKELGAAVKPVNDKLSDFVKNYATQRGIILILDLVSLAESRSIVWMNPGLDVTDDFIAEYNKANPVPGAASPTAGRPGGGR